MKYLFIPLLFIPFFTYNTTEWVREHHLERSGDRTPGIEETIVLEAKKAGIDPSVALAIGFCESRFDQYAKNSNSSAKGIYQFIDGTWNNYCEGEVYNYEDNIRCFAKNFKLNKSWWSECLN